jgi:hypothetical protein
MNYVDVAKGKVRGFVDGFYDVIKGVIDPQKILIIQLLSSLHDNNYPLKSEELSFDGELLTLTDFHPSCEVRIKLLRITYL